MSDEANDEGESVMAEKTIHVYMEGKWMEMEEKKDTLQFNGREAAVMQALSENRLLVLEPDQVKRILGSGEGLRYTSVWTTKRVKKKKKPKTYMTPLLAEDLLYRLNSRLDHLSKLLELQWTALKGTAVERSASEHSESRSATVTAEVHEKPSNKEITQSALEKPELLKGKKKEFVVSPESLEIINKFSQSNLNIIKYNGRDSVSPLTFEKDDVYCRLLLHRLNPLVELKREPYIDKLCKEVPKRKETSGQKLPLTRFAATLGLVGTEKKQFMCDILERRRKQKATSKVYRNMSDEYLTDSSDVSDIQKLQPEATRKTRAAKRKKPSPRKAAKRLKSDSVERLVSESILISSSSESTEESSFTPRKEKKNKCYKDNAKKPKTTTNYAKRVTSAESEDSVNVTKNLRSKVAITGKILRSANTSVNTTKDAAPPSSTLRDKENAKKPKTPTKQGGITSPESEDSLNITKILRSKDRGAEPKVHAKILHPKNTLVNSSKNASASNNIVSQLKKLSPDRLSESSTGTSSYVKNRVYSMLEDRIILDHILVGENQKLVKGNMLWKQFAKSYFSLANQSRTWQSLKNRYLKYILPNLKYYGLPFDKERLLRSSAFMGDNKKKTQRENSIFKVHPVISASNVLRQKVKSRELRGLLNAEPVPSTSTGRTRDTSGTAPPTAVMRTFERKKGPASSTPKNSPKKPDPTYSEVTRRFQNRAPLLASSSDDSHSGNEFKRTSRSGHRKLFYGKL